jgi:diguanylate cyclase (GGDEF)-like protein
VFGVLAGGLLASGHWLGWWPLLPLAVAVVGPGLLQAKVPHSDHQARWEAAAWTLGPVMIAVMVAATGGARSPAMAAFLLPAVTLAIRFVDRQVWFGVGALLLLLTGCTAARDPSSFAANPAPVLITATVILTATLLVGGVTAAERDFRAAATLDALTGISNRLALLSEFDLVAGRVREVGGTLALLVGDVDGLKQVNDRFGHTAGDQLLRQVARTLERSLRPEDRAYRIGGDEFVALLPGADLEAATQVAARLSAAVAETAAVPVSVAMRFGAAAAVGHEITLADLYDSADGQLIAAKQRDRERSRLQSLRV